MPPRYSTFYMTKTFLKTAKDVKEFIKELRKEEDNLKQLLEENKKT